MTAMPLVSTRVSAIQPSPASVLPRHARELRGAGRDIIEMSSGNLDFATPDHVIAAALRGETRYTDVDDCPGLTCTAPEGTLFLLVSCTGVIGKRTPDGTEINGDRDFASYLLQSADLAVFPGEDCGLSPYVRVSFANPPALIEEAGRRLKRACEALR
jgi:aspartate/methionine/tyrosine aminotransferase